MVQAFFLAFPMAAVWMIFSRQITLQSFFVGFVFGFITIFFLRRSDALHDSTFIRPQTFLSQLIGLVSYVARLLLDIYVSGFDVARRVVSKDIKSAINPGFVRIPISDPSHNSLISALSAHSITITPGTLVVEFEKEGEHEAYMLVHVLDTRLYEGDTLEKEQIERVKKINTILGSESR